MNEKKAEKKITPRAHAKLTEIAVETFERFGPWQSAATAKGQSREVYVAERVQDIEDLVLDHEDKFPEECANLLKAAEAPGADYEFFFLSLHILREKAGIMNTTEFGDRHREGGERPGDVVQSED